MKMKSGRAYADELCGGDCNHCEAIRNPQVSLLMNVLERVYGANLREIANAICGNFCCCAHCHIDDYCHFGDDDGNPLCEIDKEADRLAKYFRRKLRARMNIKKKSRIK